MSNSDESPTQLVYGQGSAEPNKYIQMVLILDVEGAMNRFLGNPFLDAVVNPTKFKRDALFYLANGLYEPFYYNVYVNRREVMLEDLFSEANGQGEEPMQKHRSLSVGDMACLTDHSVWVLTGKGWEEIVP